MRITKDGVTLNKDEQSLVARRDQALAAYDISTMSAARLVLKADTHRLPSKQFVEWFSGHTLTVVNDEVVAVVKAPAA